MYPIAGPRIAIALKIPVEEIEQYNEELEEEEEEEEKFVNASSSAIKSLVTIIALSLLRVLVFYK